MNFKDTVCATAANRYIYIFVMVFFTLFLSACDRISTPKDTAAEFWNAIKNQNMEKAKDLATWETVDYLKYLNNDKLRPERFELGEVMAGETNADVVTTLYSDQQGKPSVKIPGNTVLVKTDQGWRVDVKSTLASVVNRTVDNVFDQLNGFLREGIKELDKSLSESINQIGDALEESAKELKKELSRPVPPQQPKLDIPVQPQGRQI